MKDTTLDCPVCRHGLRIDARGLVSHIDVAGTTCTCPCDGSWADPHRHPVGDDYQLLPDGHVRVEALESGKTGVFRPDGTWLSGDLKYADPHMVSFTTSLEPIRED